MNELRSKYDLTPRDFARGRNLKIAAWIAPIVLGGLPAIIFFILMFLFGSTPPTAAVILFLGVLLASLGFLAGLIISGVMAYRHSNWTKEMRERIAADGIKAEEIEWFRNELKSSEKRALKEVERADLLLADAYRETLASRLTASRIVKSSRRELSLTERRRGKLNNLKTENAERFQQEIEKDAEKIRSIHDEAKTMLIEAESRLQMIEAAAIRGSSLVDSELALKKLSARTAELPLALESARMTDEIREEMEREESEKNSPPG